MRFCAYIYFICEYEFKTTNIATFHTPYNSCKDTSRTCPNSYLITIYLKDGRENSGKQNFDKGKYLL